MPEKPIIIESVGDHVGRFRKLELLGTGAVGAVHRVHDPELGRDVALKTLLHVSAEEIYQLKQEFRAVAGIVHPNLVRLFELFVDGENCFFTMELVRGVHLDEYVGRPAVASQSSGIRETSRRGGAVAVESPERPASFHEDRFLDAVWQIVAGLGELHAAGRIHRDLKPSNVLVTEDGRAVVLDFGFAVPWSADDQLKGREDNIAGTLPYMAPEQLFSGRVAPATDWYSLGAMMYELLLGEPPFSGSVKDVLQAKRAPLRMNIVSRLEKHGPLVAALLDPDPERRPGAADILARLGSASERRPSLLGSRPPFVGRENELARLHAALADVTDQKTPRVATVQGVSGIGKTELLRRFLAAAVTARAVTGRSLPQESVPYNTFDGAMDELSQELVQVAADRRRSLWPEHTASLLRLFPVLRRARDLESEPAELLADPGEERRFAFVALRELLERMAIDAPLIICLDDAQWGDLDSAALLGSLLNPPLRASIFVVIAYRSEEVATSAFLRAIQEIVPAEMRTDVRLEPLSETDSASLARELLEAYGHSAEIDMSALARESAGSPFFVGEMARNIVELGAADTTTAVDVIGARFERLTETEQRLVETVSAAGRAISFRAALDASGRSEATRLELTRLSDLRWLRQTLIGSQAAVQAYHDRLRERVLERLRSSPDRLRDVHGRIASTFDKPGADPEFLLFHYAAAGNRRAAGRCAFAAAERANETLAFEQAATLFLRAVELGDETHSAAMLHELRAGALTNAGRALEAARAYELAASLLHERGTEERKLDLRRRAGEHYLRTAYYDEGLAVMSEVLGAVGEKLPRTQRQALLPSVIGRVRFLVRGNDFVQREKHEVPKEKWRRLEVLWSTGISLAILDYQRADPIALAHLHGALDHGECAQALRALAYESSVQAGIGGAFFRARSATIQRLVYDLAEKRGVPYERAWARLAIGSSAWFTGLWRQCVQYCDEGAAIFREQCRGVPWEIATMDLFALSALGIMGDVEELERRLPLAIKSAEERGDLYALNNCRLGQPSILWLARDRVSELRELALKADRSMWKGGYHAQRYHYALAVGQADLYDGDPWSCITRLAEHWPGLKESRIYHLEWPHIELRHLRARAWLLAAKSMRDGAHVPPTHRRLSYDRLVRAVRDEAKAIAKHAISPAAALACTLTSSLASVTGERNASAYRERAEQACLRADMKLMATLLANPNAGTPKLRHALGVH